MPKAGSSRIRLNILGERVSVASVISENWCNYHPSPRWQDGRSREAFVEQGK